MRYLYDSRRNIVEVKEDEGWDHPIAVISLFVLMGVVSILVMCM